MERKEVTKFLEKHRDELVQMRRNGFTCKEIGDMYGLNPNSLGNWFRKNNIYSSKISTNPIIVEEVIHMYTLEKKTTREIAEKLKIGSTTVCAILHNNNIKMLPKNEFNKKYKLNEHYFDNIDTPNKAYILGLLYSDGNLSKSGYVVSLGLQENDKHILESINKELNYDKPLSFIDNSHRDGVQNQYLLRIHNKYMSEVLMNYGFVPCKSLILSFPYWMSNNLLRHFIRGYMDGDGTISKHSRWKNMAFVGSESMMTGIKEYLEDELGVHCSIYFHPNKTTKIISISGGKQVKKVLDHLYNDAELFLYRKFKIYENLYVNKTYMNNSQIA